jgi:hypothetical protein
MEDRGYLPADNPENHLTFDELVHDFRPFDEHFGKILCSVFRRQLVSGMRFVFDCFNDKFYRFNSEFLIIHEVPPALVSEDSEET